MVAQWHDVLGRAEYWSDTMYSQSLTHSFDSWHNILKIQILDEVENPDLKAPKNYNSWNAV